MDEVTFTPKGVKQVARLLSAPPEGAYLYASAYGIGAAGVGLGWAAEPWPGTGRYIYNSGPDQGDSLSSDRPLTDAELDAVLEAGGFKPVEPAGHWEPIEARDIKVGDKLRVSRVSGGCDWKLGDEFEVTRAPQYHRVPGSLTVTHPASMEAGRALVAAYYGLEVWRTPTPVRTYEEGYADGSADATQSALNQGYDKGFEGGRDAGVNDVRSMLAALTDIEEFDRAFEGAKAARLAYWDAIGEPRHSEPGPISLNGWVAASRAAAGV